MPGLTLLSALLLAGAEPRPPAPVAEVPRQIAPSKIILVGDSTTAVVGGWGPSFCAYHVTSFAACLNLARGGRSSGNYRAEGSWDVALGEMRTPGYRNIWVLIQFGHNDQPGKPGRSTDLATEFPANLARYVDETRAAGAIPILVTPLTRRMFEGGKLGRDLEPWAAAVRKVARDKQVPLLDLYADSVTAVETMGEERADALAQGPRPAPGEMPAATAPTLVEVSDVPMAERKGGFDRTHLGAQGAHLFAAMVAGELHVAVPEMRGVLRR